MRVEQEPGQKQRTQHCTQWPTWTLILLEVKRQHPRHFDDHCHMQFEAKRVFLGLLSKGANSGDGGKVKWMPNEEKVMRGNRPTRTPEHKGIRRTEQQKQQKPKWVHPLGAMWGIPISKHRDYQKEVKQIQSERWWIKVRAGKFEGDIASEKWVRWIR